MQMHNTYGLVMIVADDHLADTMGFHVFQTGFGQHIFLSRFGVGVTRSMAVGIHVVDNPADIGVTMLKALGR